ncbi:MAG: B12-binding domain-containing radical SAM protein [Candidatus Desulfofervidaceae bacterium]|nr:B12-binding domain-containing radical SAM protein [Candidatus Desulfofervidaceae bacterium]
MKVLLVEVNPFSPPTLPISLGYIAAFLKKHGFQTKILTISEQTEYSLNSLSNFIRDFSPQLVGFSVFQRNILYVLGLASFVKSLNPEIKVALGGPQITFMPSEALKQMPMVDYLCRSEGEFALLSIAQAIAGGNPENGIRGTTYRVGEEIVEGEPIEGFEDLDEYPSPHLMDVFDYTSVEEVIMLSSRGCPYNCIFCYTPQAFNHKIRFHSIERVIEEIKWVIKKGKNCFWFADPNFSFRGERVHQLLDEIIRQELKVSMWLETRVDLINEDMIKKMKRAGVHTIAYGLESASKRILKIIKKKTSLEQLERAISFAQKYDIEVELFSLFGLPGETFAEAVQTLEFVKSHGIKIQGNSNAQQMQLYFGTPLTRNYAQYGIKPLPEKRPAYISIGDRYETETMSREEIEKIKMLWRKHSLDKGRRLVS